MSRAALGLAAVIVVGTVVYASLGGLLRGPSVFADELIYMDATRSIAGGHRPMERDQKYGRGPLYPALAAPVLAAAPNQRDGYRWLKAYNALLFSLTAIPAFLLARRFLDRRWSLAVAALSVAAPSAVYTGMVLTESTAYLTGTLALLALVIVLERPSARHQLLALGAVVLATLARPQLIALAAAIPAGLGLRWLLLPARSRPQAGAALRKLWPTAAAVGVAVAIAAVALGTGHASLRDYRDVFRSYNAADVVRWSWYTLANLGLYLALIPMVAIPAAIGDLWRRGREGSVRDAALLGLFVSVSLVTVVLVAAFSSASFGGDRLHDRYLFYVVPLWLVVFASWLDRRARASWRSLAIGSAFGVVLVASLPPRLLVHDTNFQFDAVASAIWSRLREIDPARPGVLRLLLVLGVFAALGAIIGLRRFTPVLLLPVAAVFVLNAILVWQSRIHDADLRVFADNRPETWSWVDHALPSGGKVTDLFVQSGNCQRVNTGALRWTEFFNGRVGSVIRIGVPERITIDGRSAIVGGDGTVRTLDGRPVVPGYAVAPPGLELRGREVARGTLDALRLWRVDGTLRILNAKSNAQALTVVCPGGAA